MGTRRHTHTHTHYIISAAAFRPQRSVWKHTHIASLSYIISLGQMQPELNMWVFSSLRFQSYKKKKLPLLHPSLVPLTPVLPTHFVCGSGGKVGWGEPGTCNLRPDFHWKQMLSIHCKDRLMFSKAYNNKPRGSSQCRLGKQRRAATEYQLSQWADLVRGEKFRA